MITLSKHPEHTEMNFDEVFGKISKLYDRAENILKTAYHPSITNQAEFLEEIYTIVEQIEESANIIASDFGRIIESGQEPNNAMKIRVNSALRKILLSIDAYRERVNNLTGTKGN